MTGFAFFTVHVSVTEHDLTVGGRDCLHCPVALAVHRALPGSDVSVFADRIRIDCVPHDTPQLVRDFVMEWDDVHTPLRRERAWFTPFEFELVVRVPAWDAAAFVARNKLPLEAEAA